MMLGCASISSLAGKTAGMLRLAALAMVVYAAPAAAADPSQPLKVPAPVPARPPAAAPAKPVAAVAADAAKARARVMAGVQSFAYQLVGLKLAEAESSPYDLIIVDATTGHGDGQPLTAADVARLKRKPDGSRRLVLSYLSIGEAEDYRPDYFATEYMTEDAPDWLMSENPQWKGNRIIRFCHEGWQRTVLGDDKGRSLYNSIEPSPLYRLVELGLDGVALDRVDVYGEVKKECPDARAKMVDFVARLAAHARKKNAGFLVLLHNAEELLVEPRMIAAIDAAVKEDLIYNAGKEGTANPESMIRPSIASLDLARKAGKPVLVIDYLKDRARIEEARRRIESHGFIAYFGPRKLDSLWLPGVNF
jgi:cysteinyl-tRNA synthetase